MLVIFVSHLYPNRFKDWIESAKDFHRFFSSGQFWHGAARSEEQQKKNAKNKNKTISEPKVFLKGLHRDELSDVSPTARICCVWYICSSATES